MALRLLIVVALVASASAGKVTPIEKVTQLLKGLQTKIAEEGKKEAAAYDKYSCFCKEQADGKLYAIEKSTAKIASLSAEIEAGNTQIASLNGEVSGLSKKISATSKQIDADAAARKADHAKYQAKAKDLTEAIASSENAIAAMKGSKDDLTDAKVNLLEVNSLIAKYSKPAAKFTYQSNDIIATIEGLLAKQKQMKAALDSDEHDVNSLFEKKTLGNNNENTFATKEKDEKAALVEAKTEEVMAARESREEENGDKAADEEFMATLTAGCEGKAKLFDQRSQTRTAELTAMTGAIEQLETGVKDNAGANKKLVLVQIRDHVEGRNVAVSRVHDLLQEAAGRLDSVVLQSVAVKVLLAGDHFVKVRGLIKDLVAKLKADATSEATQKGFCDKAMKAAVHDRDTGKSNQEAAAAELGSLNALKSSLVSDIADLGRLVAENKKGLNEATELRANEKAENAETVASAKQGKAAVDMALSLLSSFYKTALLQSSSVKYTPPKSDRSGKTVGDLAPDTFKDDYHGAQSASKGIIGILEVIASDFERSIKTVTSDEANASAEFGKFKKATDDDVAADMKTSKKKEDALAGAKDDALKQEEDLSDANKRVEGGMASLEALHSSCVEGEETYAERTAARKKEIESLKDAQQILDEWQGA